MATKDYPYSSLFDYDQIAREEEERKQRQQASQQKIMRTNALGDALRLLVDVAGGSRGATITPKPVNPGIMKASDRLKAIEDQHRADMQRWKMQDLAMKTRDMDYNLGLKAEERAYENKKELFGLEQQAKEKAEERAFGRQKELIDLQGAKQKDVDRFRTDQEIRQYEAKVKTEKEALNTNIKRDRSKPLKKDDILFQIPGTTQKIYIGTDEAAEMAHRLISEFNDSGSFIMDPTLRAIDQNETVKPSSLIEVIKKNWDRVKYVLPEYAGNAAGPPPELTPTEKRKMKYDKELEDIQTNINLSQKERMRKIRQLKKDNKDILDMAAQQELIPTDASGVTDVSILFN